ncbi:hypothetical protein B1987_28105 [Mycobacterium kansasii]|nr:hypothetical protein B1987_28105 [Mycobacterium kansasii]
MNMSFVSAVPEAVQAAAQDLAGIRVTLEEATAAVAASTTTTLAGAGQYEVSAAIAALFGTFGQEYQAVSAQASAFHAAFVKLLSGAASSYVEAEDSQCCFHPQWPECRCRNGRWAQWWSDGRLQWRTGSSGRQLAGDGIWCRSVRSRVANRRCHRVRRRDGFGSDGRNHCGGRSILAESRCPDVGHWCWVECPGRSGPDTGIGGGRFAERTTKCVAFRQFRPWLAGADRRAQQWL